VILSPTRRSKRRAAGTVDRRTAATQARRVAAAAGIQMVKTPPQAPKANAPAEHWVRTVRSERLDRVLTCSHHHLERVLADHVRRYHTARPHHGIDLDLPVPPVGNTNSRTQTIGRIERVDVLGGLIHEHRHAA
jgi:putative transposase